LRTLGNQTLHLTVRQLAKAYGLLWALRDISLDIPPGEFVALLGPNGAGKSTLLKLLAGLTHATRGGIEIDGVDVSRAPTAVRSTIGLLSPAEHLYDNLTVRENLRFFTSLYKKKLSSAAIDAALAGVALKHRSDEIVAALSSGMKCRLSIAKWELLQPGLLLLDEPYGVLDGSGVNLLEEFLKSHCRKGNIVIMASHHVARVLNICTRAVILHQGKLTFNEPRQQPWDSFTQAFGEFLPDGESWTS
jgi:heme ABC exporter ATP-binding subunit CcmA